MPARRQSLAQMQPQGRAVTLRDVARLAGTTPMTVSNVINSRAGQVSEALTLKVREACAQLGYRPHAQGRRLRTRRTMTIGVIIVDPSPHYLSDPFTAALLAGLNDGLAAAGYSLAINGASHDGLADLPLLGRIESDAVCLLSSGAPAGRGRILGEVARLGQPLLLFQETLPAEVSDGASLRQDDFGGGVAVARHALAAPMRQAAFLRPALDWPAMERREAGIRSVLAQLAAPPALHVIACGDESYDETQAAFAAHVARHGMPEVILGGNDRMAIAAMKLALARGHAVPDQVRVTGFNGFDFWRYASPELTTVLSPAFELGEAGAAALATRLQTGAFPFRDRVLPVVFRPNRSSQRESGHACQPIAIRSV